MNTLFVEFDSGKRLTIIQAEPMVQPATITDLQLKYGAIQSYCLEDEAGTIVEAWDHLETVAEEAGGDGQPSEYDEWQDFMGGDDSDHGQYEY